MADILSGPPPAEAEIVANVPLEGAERRGALDLVEDMQSSRGSRLIKPADVPHVLLPYQQRWHADRSAVRLCVKSRRVGFSWGSLAAEAALAAACTREAGGMDQFYMGYNMSMAAEFIGDSAFFAKAFGAAVTAIDAWKTTVVIGNERRDIVTYKITFASGYRIEALSSNPHNWRGKQGHARIDEAAFHPNLAEVVKGAMAFKMWGGRIDVVSTHNGDENPFNLLLREVQEGKLPWSLHTVSFAAALADGFYRRVCLVRGLDYSAEAQETYRAGIYADYPTAEDAAEELDCVPKRGSGAYFSRILLENCQEDGLPVLRWSVPTDFVLDPDRLAVARRWIAEHLQPVLDALDTTKRTVLGQDFGRSGDLSVIKVLQEETPTLWRNVVSIELRRCPFDVQQLILFALIDGLPLFHHGKLDARGNGQSHAEAALQRYGAARIDCVMATVPWYAENFPRYRRAYEDRAIRVPQSEDDIADHRSVILVRGNPTMADGRTKGSDGEYRHGDAAIAGVLAWAATRQEAQPSAGSSIDHHTRADRPRLPAIAGRRPPPVRRR